VAASLMSARAQAYRIEPGQRLGGEISVPGDKSISHRAVMLGGIARGTTTVDGFLESEDCLATLSAFGQMGVHTRLLEGGSLVIEGVGMNGLVDPAAALDLGNSGTAMRLMLGLLAGLGVNATLTGDASLRERPMERVATPLRRMGADIETRDGRAPIRVKGGRRLRGIHYKLPVASAQIKSALLLAALSAEGRTEIVSPAPTRDHTERMLETMGVVLDTSDDGLRVTLDGPVVLESADIGVPGDLSSAAFFLVGACLGRGEPLLIRRVGINPTRDGVLTILQRMGARIALENPAFLGAEPVADIRAYPSELHGIEIGRDLVPLAIDELPVLFVAAAAARGRTIVSGAEELRVKESDRIRAMAAALRAVGASARETADGMVIEGGGIAGGDVASLGDHRIAMAFAIASLVSDGPIRIADTGPVATSFPGFVETAARAGLAIHVSAD
jgi:3-phosphoshikimate 1-carboxyvinyltransferase